jgi:hypothetical protein
LPWYKKKEAGHYSGLYENNFKSRITFDAAPQFYALRHTR